ncbi:hypothetical protein LWI28_028000 [Acer negundo]|uniref:Uncharacterized protein n=1 Tax=Acer negundo TaxID=4023 RepID=A0AAD5IQ44_ACENE|nr:hypothetical protein LWI28_028000 [Acer negundo]
MIHTRRKSGLSWNTTYIRGFEYPFPTQFTAKDKWANGVLPLESKDILGRIMKRRYTNMQYHTLDPFEGAKLERYLRISFALPRGLALPPSTSSVPSHLPSPSNTSKVTTESTQPNIDPIPLLVPAKSHAKIPTPSPASVGSLARTLAHPSTRTPARPSIKVMLARAAKVWGSSKQSQRKTRKVAAPLAMSTPPIPPPTVMPSKKGAIHGEVVSRFITSCPGGSLMGMAKLPTEILVANGASVLAEARLEDTQQEPAQAQQSVAPFFQVAAASEKVEEEEDTLAGSKVPAIKETLTDTAADVTRAEVASQGVNLEEEENT